VVKDPSTSSSRKTEEVQLLAAHLFRHSAGKLTARLTRILGWEAVDTAADIVQEALLAALQVWPYKGVPDNPEGWIWRVARNRATDRTRHATLAASKADAVAYELESSRAEDHCDEDELAMMYVCAHPALPQEAQVALMLRILGGFTTREIALAYLTQEATVAQRIVRAKQKLRDAGVIVEVPSGGDVTERTDAVLLALYLMFNEGYSAHSGPNLLRDDLCSEAIRLTGLVCANPATNAPKVHALLALQYLQASRLATRTDDLGNLLLLSVQDRTQWDRALMAQGFAHLERAACGVEVSTYHMEAGIAACHASAPSYEDTEWSQILSLYDQLVESNASPVFALNRAVALAAVHGNRAALDDIERLAGDKRFDSYHLYFATLAELQSREGDTTGARHNFQRALELAGSEPERAFLQRRLSETA
jgi:RNA polymerase sigma factor (sigma-70 family)